MENALTWNGAARVHHALLFTLLVAAALLAPRPTGAQSLPGTEARLCTDDAWADYNGCLMESDGFFHRLTCDLAFEADVIWCSAKYGGQVKNAWNGQV